MKIGLVRRGYSQTGGAEAYLFRLAGGLLKAGHDPVLIGSTEWPDGSWPGECVIRMPGSSPMKFARNVERATEGCDVVFSMERVFACDLYRAGDGVHAAWLERRSRFEPAWRRWARGWNRKHAELLELERCVFDPARTRWVIANSAMVRDEIVRFYGYPEDRISVVRNGADAAQGGWTGRSKEPEVAALFAGSGWERKGLRFAVEAVQAVKGLRLLVAGRGNPRGLRNDRVEFLGPAREMAPVYAKADLFVLPTIYDPFSNACLEALAAGLPVITTSANGFAEIIEAGVHGEIVESGDVSGLRRALAAWCDRERIEAARPACRELATRYSVEENVGRTLEVIERALGERSRGG